MKHPAPPRQLRLTKSRLAAGRRLDEHDHPWATLHWIRAGSYDETIESRHYRCRPGELLFKPAFIAHANPNASRAADFFRFEIATHLLPDRLREIRGEQRVSAQLVPTIVQTIRHVATAEVPQLAADELVQELALEIVSTNATADTSKAKRARAFIDRYFEHTFSLTELAVECGVARETLSRSFRLRYGITMHAYQTRLRLARAIHCLLDGEGPGEIATSLGFADQAHFIRTFRKVLGLAPGQWQRQSQIFNTPFPAPSDAAVPLQR